MSLQPCEEVNNIHEGIIYTYSFVKQNTSTTSNVTFQQFLYELAGALKAKINALPQGYYWELVSIQLNSMTCLPTSSHERNTGGSGDVNISFTSKVVTTNGFGEYTYYMNSGALANNRYSTLSVNVSGSSPAFSGAVKDTDEFIPRKTTSDIPSKTATVLYKIYVSDSSNPTE